ncbi:NAD(P)-dependent oxidoreductase [Donghicola mangrovi]|uniref:NAD(P)-dependent oxidoreductase n=1 Tax=Donghicola mangrovi TaxID=2729614 RepID=A0A850Q8Y6_9RHOB|nr:NAD(P)-dependent oxidoreductase [Donghicola mangrovi]NVO25413.1 NAD(P)-dependent oxidoreductase [Donghicola mangrovi]
MADKQVIGFIGLGFMGHGMAKNIRQAGYELWIKGRKNRTPIDNLLAMGANEATSPREMAEKCDVIHLCLSTSAQVEATMLGEDGILAGARPGLIVVDASTADPASTERMAKALAEKGGSYVDAPLGGTPVQAEEGTLSAMVGADAAAFDAVLPVIQTWAKTITHVGEVGAGHKMKLLMNFIGLSYGALFSEASVLAAKVGISPAVFREVISPSRMGNGFFETFMAYVVDRDRDSHKFTIENAAKDMGYLNDMATGAGVMNVMAGAARQYYLHAMSTGHDQDYVPHLSDRVAALNGIDLADFAKK